MNLYYGQASLSQKGSFEQKYVLSFDQNSLQIGKLELFIQIQNTIWNTNVLALVARETYSEDLQK